MNAYKLAVLLICMLQDILHLMKYRLKPGLKKNHLPLGHLILNQNLNPSGASHLTVILSKEEQFNITR